MSIETEEDLEALRRVGRVVGLTLREMKRAVRAGITTAELDAIAEAILAKHGARSAPRLVYAFPGATCISTNDEAVHGIPGPRALQSSDLVKLDVTAELDGYIADAAVTVGVGTVPARQQRLAACAATALQKAMRVARAGRPIREIGRAVQGEVERQGFRVLRELCGHGVGRTIHEEPRFIPNYDDGSATDLLAEGMVITIEPIISVGATHVQTAKDGWTLRTADGSPSAHAEHTIVITRGEPIVLTAV
jgi:methionyl aminopeptidase